MSVISAGMVKELRERTGSGMMECKKALVETQGDVEQAIDYLRKNGMAKAAKKAGRVAAEGQIVIEADDKMQKALMLEINCETDFVSRDQNFMQFSKAVVNKALSENQEQIDKISNLVLDQSQQTIEQSRSELVIKVGENVQLRRAKLLETNNVLGLYVHGGRIGAMVEITGSDPALARDVAMHVAASNPMVMTRDEVPQSAIDREKEIFMVQARESGKPEEIIEKMVSGRINKFLDEMSLEGQPFVKDPSVKVGQFLKQSGVQMLSMVRFELGDGIEKEEVDFAQEVMAQVKGE